MDRNSHNNSGKVQTYRRVAHLHRSACIIDKAIMADRAHSLHWKGLELTQRGYKCRQSFRSRSWCDECINKTGHRVTWSIKPFQIRCDER